MSRCVEKNVSRETGESDSAAANLAGRHNDGVVRWMSSESLGRVNVCVCLGKCFDLVRLWRAA
jgi:hypothetical protein